MKILSLKDLQDGFSYLVSHPDFLLRAIVNAARMRFGVPMDAVAWLLGKLARGRLPEDMTLQALPPGLAASASVEFMGTRMFVAATVLVDQIQLGEGSVRVHLRVRDLRIKAPADSPMAGMLGMMDLSKPGDLLAFMPTKPKLILEASGDRFVIDLMKHPKLAANPVARKLVAAMSEVLAVKEFQTEGDLLVIGFRAIPMGLLAAIRTLRT